MMIFNLAPVLCEDLEIPRHGLGGCEFTGKVDSVMLPLITEFSCSAVHRDTLYKCNHLFQADLVIEEIKRIPYKAAFLIRWLQNKDLNNISINASRIVIFGISKE